MKTEQMFDLNNIMSTHSYKDVVYNLFQTANQIGWSALINGQMYGNWTTSNGQWFKSGSPLKIEDVIHENAQQSINIILQK